MQPSGDARDLTIHDVVGLLCSGVCLMWTASAELLVAPVFANMMKDFSVRLPWLTLACLTWWFPLGLGLLPLAMTLSGIVGRASRQVRVLLMVASILFMLMAPAIFMLGMYMPLQAISGKIE